MSSVQLDKFHINRRAVRLQDIDNKIRVPKDINERCWAEILQKEDIDLMLFDVREEIFEEAVNICHEKYMERQNTSFTVHCAAEAFLKFIDWAFYRHDPGLDRYHPPCYIPGLAESWIPDAPPDPSPKDTMSRHDLEVLEEVYEDASLKRKWPSNSSIDYPVIEEISQEYWFPGKVKLPGLEDEVEEDDSKSQTKTSPRTFTASSEILQRVTDYGIDTGPKPSAKSSKSKMIEFLQEPSLQGAGDSISSINLDYKRSVQHTKRKSIAQPRRSTMPSGMLNASSTRTRSRMSSSRILPPLEIPATPISDCRLRTLRRQSKSLQKMSSIPLFGTSANHATAQI